MPWKTAKLTASYQPYSGNTYLSGQHATAISEDGGLIVLGTGYVDLKSGPSSFGNPGAVYFYQRGTSWQSRTENSYISNAYGL